MSDKRDEQGEHLGEWKEGHVSGGSLDSSRVTLTGKDFIGDINRKYMEAVNDGNTKMNRSQWIEKQGYKDKYDEARAFSRSGDEDPESLGEYNQNRDAMNQ